MKAKYASLLLLCICIIFSGCKAVPKEVNERMEQYGDNKQMLPDDITYCTIDELQKTTIEDVNVELDNMVLPEKVDFSGVESVETLELAFEENALLREDNYLKVFGIDRRTLTDEDVKSDKNKVISCRVYESADTKKYFAMDDRGWLAYSSGKAYDSLNGNLEKK